MGYIKIILLAALAMLGVLLVVQNLDSLMQAVSLKLNLYFCEHATEPYPVYLLLMLSFLLGVFLTSLLGFGERLRIRKAIKEAARQREDLEREIASLRRLSYNLANQPGAGAAGQSSKAPSA